MPNELMNPHVFDTTRWPQRPTQQTGQRSPSKNIRPHHTQGSKSHLQAIQAVRPPSGAGPGFGPAFVDILLSARPNVPARPGASGSSNCVGARSSASSLEWSSSSSCSCTSELFPGGDRAAASLLLVWLRSSESGSLLTTMLLCKVVHLVGIGEPASSLLLLQVMIVKSSLGVA